jgi:hypothetical protein
MKLNHATKVMAMRFALSNAKWLQHKEDICHTRRVQTLDALVTDLRTNGPQRQQQLVRDRLSLLNAVPVLSGGAVISEDDECKTVSEQIAHMVNNDDADIASQSSSAAAADFDGEDAVREADFLYYRTVTVSSMTTSSYGRKRKNTNN